MPISSPILSRSALAQCDSHDNMAVLQNSLGTLASVIQDFLLLLLLISTRKSSGPVLDEPLVSLHETGEACATGHYQVGVS